MNSDWPIKFFAFGKNISIKLVYVLIGIVCFIPETFNTNITFLIIISPANVYTTSKWKSSTHDHKGSHALLYSFNRVGKNVSKASPLKNNFCDVYEDIHALHVYYLETFKDENCAKDNGKVDVTLSMISNVEKNAITLAFFFYL